MSISLQPHTMKCDQSHKELSVDMFQRFFEQNRLLRRHWKLISLKATIQL